MNRQAIKNKEVKNNKEIDIPIPFWVKLVGQEYPVMFICWKDFQWCGKDMLIVDGVSIEFPIYIEYVQQDFSGRTEEETKRWYNQKDYEDEYILSKA